MNKPFLIGERLYLRPLEEEDIDRCLVWINDPEITATVALRFPFNRSREKEWFAALYKTDRDIPLAIVLKDGDRHIGNCGLHQIDYPNRCAQFGIMIGEKEEWDKGYASEASRLILDYGFDQLGLHRISLQVYAHNLRAQRVYEKLGFTREGVLRESYYRDGRYHDTVIMGILRSEWRGDGPSVLE
jgi:RimJ/RimL family protein N-acetyltransferase